MGLFRSNRGTAPRKPPSQNPPSRSTNTAQASPPVDDEDLQQSGSETCKEDPRSRNPSPQLTDTAQTSPHVDNDTHQQFGAETSKLVPNPGSPPSSMQTEVKSGESCPTTPPLDAWMATKPSSKPSSKATASSKPKSTPKPKVAPKEQNTPSENTENTDKLVQQLLESLDEQHLMRDELARLDRQLDQQALAHSFLRATKNLEQKQPFKAREWVKNAEEITLRLNDTDNQARCLYWFGRIDWYEGHETEAYFRFREAAQKLAHGCDEMRRIPMYLEWLRPGVEKDKRRARLSRHGFHPPHESKPTHVSRQKVPASSAVPGDVLYNRYSHPGLKRKRENMEPDVAIELDVPCKASHRREPRSRTVMTFESDRHIHPGDKLYADPPRLHHLAYDFSWKRPQQLPHHPPSQRVFDFSKKPKGRASRFRSHKIFTKQPWEEKVPKRAPRTRADGKTDVTMTMLAEELNPTQYQALRYGSRARRS